MELQEFARLFAINDHLLQVSTHSPVLSTLFYYLTLLGANALFIYLYFGVVTRNI